MGTIEKGKSYNENMMTFIIITILLFTICGTAAVAGRNRIATSQKIRYTNTTIKTAVSENESINNRKYNLRLPDSKIINQGSFLDAILSICTLRNTSVINGTKISTYSSKSMTKYLHNCHEISDIAKVNDVIYIFYSTKSGENIILCYNNSGLLNRSIYNAATGTAIINEKGNESNYTNYREGTHYEMSDEMVTQINKCVAKGDLDTLKSDEDIKVIEDDAGNIIIEPNIEFGVTGEQEIVPYALDNSLCGVVEFNNEKFIRHNLKDNFPMYTKSPINNASTYCSALNKNVNITMFETRNAYIRNQGDVHAFLAGTPVTAVATALGIASITPVFAILSVTGIAISAESTIMSAVRLCRSAVYSYQALRLGCAFDKTVWYAYVLVKQFPGTGQCAGAYNSSGQWEWAHTINGSAFYQEPRLIFDTTMYSYNADIAVFGYCAMYHPID